MRLPFVALLCLLPLAALAGDEPETVYERYHNAAIRGRLDEMLVHGLVKQREELQRASPAERDAALKMARTSMPPTYTVDRRTIEGKRATLLVSGPAEPGRVPSTIFGRVTLSIDADMWKVAEVAWDTEKPAAAAPKPAPAAARPAVSSKGAPMVGSTAGEPLRKLGTAKPVCEFKPVMTAQDLELCK